MWPAAHAKHRPLWFGISSHVGKSNSYLDVQLANPGRKFVRKFWFCKLALTCLELRANYFKSRRRMASLSSNSSISAALVHEVP